MSFSRNEMSCNLFSNVLSEVHGPNRAQIYATFGRVVTIPERDLSREQEIGSERDESRKRRYEFREADRRNSMGRGRDKLSSRFRVLVCAPTLFRILQDTSGNEDVLPGTPPESITRSYQSQSDFLPFSRVSRLIRFFPSCAPPP